MSSYKGHLFGGALFFIPFAYVLAYYFGYSEKSQFEIALQGGLLFGITLLFALFADIDTKSKGQKIFYLIFLLVDLALMVQGLWQLAAFIGLFAMLPIISNHRGWTHSIYAVILIPAPFLIIPMWIESQYTLAGLEYYLAAVVGYLSHRFMDGIFFRRKK